MILESEDITKLLFALLVGGIVGAEREVRDKSAGFRTMILVCVGSALFTIFSLHIAAAPGRIIGGDPARVAAQIVSGIGFLGAGAILRYGAEIRGLTTASTIWMVAALGMGAGAGLYIFSIIAALVTLLILWLFPKVEQAMGTFSQNRQYRVVVPVLREKFDELNGMMEEYLHVEDVRRTRQGGDMICTWITVGAPKKHDEVVEKLFEDQEIKEFSY